MSIIAYTGKTGSGKTFCMVEDAYKRWFRGEDIYSNTVLLFANFGGTPNSNIIDDKDCFTKWEHIQWFFKKNTFMILSKVLRREFDIFAPSRGNIRYFEDITEILEVRDGLILIDEGQELLEARNWENLPFEFSNKLRQHRKHNLDLAITTQNIGTVDKNYRRLVQHWIHAEDRFALFGLRNPSLFSVHARKIKDIDQLWGNPEELNVDTLKAKSFYIHKLTKRKYDTLYDIGFKAYKIIWIEEETTNTKGKVCLIIPKTWTLSHARTQLLLQKYYLDRNKYPSSKSAWKT